jgi:HAD superfamily hydrolase (TIGR01549 family)
MSIDAVIFDWGGTLTPWHTLDIREMWRAYTWVYDPLRADELAGELHQAETATWAAARDHQRSGTLEDVLRSAGVEPSGSRHEEALTAYQEAWDPHTWTDPDVVPLLEGLRDRGLAVGILSNTLWTRDYHEAVLARDGVLHLIDAAVFSSEIPWTKPHPEAFLAAMSAVDVDDPERCVFVGDRPFDDIHGAKEVGMRAVLVPHSTIPHDQRGHVEGSPDAVIDSLADLLPIIDSWR